MKLFKFCKHWIFPLFIFLIWLGIVCQIKGIYHTHCQWDFRAHYYAAKAYRQGLNAYALDDVNRVNETGITIPAPHFFSYNPLILRFDSLLTWIPYPYALTLINGFYFLLVAVMIFIFSWGFLGRPLQLGILLLAPFFFNLTIPTCLAAGQSAMLESLVIWCAFWAVTTGRTKTFLALIAGLSLLKMVPIVLTLTILLLPDREKNKKWLAATWAIFGILYFSPLVWAPTDFQNFLRLDKTLLGEMGMNNPSSFAFFHDCSQKLLHLELESRIFSIPTLGYLAWVVIVVTMAWRAIRRMTWERDARYLMMLLLVGYALLAPRFKNYTYVELVPIAAWASFYEPLLLPFLLLGMIFPFLHIGGYFLNAYHPLMALLALWMVLLRGSSTDLINKTR